MSLQRVIFNTCYRHIVDHGGKPYVLIDTRMIPENTLQPYANTDGSIILNITMQAVNNFYVTNEGLEISLRFRGQIVDVSVPFSAICAIYDKDTPQIGMLFNMSFPQGINSKQMKPTEQEPPTKKRPTLTVVK